MKNIAQSEDLKSRIETGFDKIKKLLDKLFQTRKMCNTAISYVHGLLSCVERKNCWQLAEEAGLSDPHGFQYLLNRACFDVGLLRDQVRAYTIENLGSNESRLSLDETGFLKKGLQSAGVNRQYSGTAGRIENCQIGVFLSYAAGAGRALIDRELYLPKVWIEDKSRCQNARIPSEVTFKTKPELAVQMLERAFLSGIKSDWVLGDEVYGCAMLRHWLEDRRQAYVLAVASNCSVFLGMRQYTVSELTKTFSETAWERLSCGKGSKGERYDQWQRIEVNALLPEGFVRYLLVRRSCKDPEEMAYYIAFSHEKKTLLDMAKAAGSRWNIEECFEMAKGETGLDQYEVRTFEGWYRHITFSMLALSFLTDLKQRFNQAELAAELQIEKKNHPQKTSSLRGFLANRGLA
jgi:SRSO17 transposase